MKTPVKSIRAKCLDCMCGSPQEVRLCPSENCPLYPYRMGRRPRQCKDTSDTVDAENPTASYMYFGKEQEKERPLA